MSYNEEVLKVGQEQFDLAGNTDPKAAVAIMLKRDKALAEVFESDINIKELEDKTRKLFNDTFKPTKKTKAEKEEVVTPKAAKPKGKKVASVKATPTVSAKSKKEIEAEVEIPDMS